MNGEYHTGRVELEGRPRYLHRATVQFTPSETDEQAVYLRKSTGESVTAGVASNITEWQYPLPQGLAPTIKVRIETMDPLTNHGTYSTPGMNQPKKFIYNPAIMNDSASPQMGRIMWIATRTAFVGVEAYIEPYRFILDREEIERTRAFIAPQSLIDPLSHLFPGALLLIGDFDPDIILARGPEAVTMVFDHYDLAHFGSRANDLNGEFSLEKIIDYITRKYQLIEDHERLECEEKNMTPEETNEFFLTEPTLYQICNINSFFRSLYPSNPFLEKLTILVNPIKMLGGEVKLASSKHTYVSRLCRLGKSFYGLIPLGSEDLPTTHHPPRPPPGKNGPPQ